MPEHVWRLLRAVVVLVHFVPLAEADTSRIVVDLEFKHYVEQDQSIEGTESASKELAHLHDPVRVRVSRDDLLRGLRISVVGELHEQRPVSFSVHLRQQRLTG